jgi:hypothetical protein
MLLTEGSPMEKMRKIWDAIVNFLVTYDSHKISQLFASLKWEEVLRNPFVWLIGLPTLGYMLYRKQFKTLVLIVSLAAFLYLLQITFPPSAQTIPLEKLLRFIGGCVFLCVLNLYLLFVRQD